MQTRKMSLLAAITLLLLPTLGLFAQQPPTGMPGGMPGGRMMGDPSKMNVGRFYGKIVDENNKGVAYASVALYGMRFDTVSRSLKETLIAGQITEENGDFSLEKLPVFGEFTLKITFLGYADVEKKVSFGFTRDKMNGVNPVQGGSLAGLADKVDVDLGNIPLIVSSKTLETVTVTGEASAVTLALDKKVYRVDKNANAAGGTAEDAMKNVPSLSVDLDGNLTMRNAAPQLFVDGRPTTLTLDQISADAIESIEVISNPSAKYDASGGQAGIVNIVLKKDKRIGYNGNVRAGVDSRGGINAGGDINAREGKFNAFISGNYNQRRSFSDAETDRQNLIGNPPTRILQTTDNEMNGFFANGRAGVDWFVDNRNTLTLSGSYTRGQFSPEDVINIKTDSLYNGYTSMSEAIRSSNNERNFRNLGGSLLYKHLFPKSGQELTADINFNNVRNDGAGNYTTQYFDPDFQTMERQESGGTSRFVTIQSDYVEPLSDKIKLEFGARAALRRNTNDNTNYFFDAGEQVWTPLPTFADQYEFDDQVYAAYGTFSHQFTNWGYQLGLRAESSRYTGDLTAVDSSFTNDYPLSLFPSIFVTRKLNDQDNIQLSYTRRINRPNFFQLMPFTDFSDSLNLSRGNPDLLPEFTNSFEISYQNIFNNGHNLLITAYYKQATDLITRYQFTEFNEALNRDIIVSTYANSNSSQAYGVEFTLKNTFFKILELTSNLNLYNAKVDASNIENGLINEQFTWYLKENMMVKLPAQFSLQISGEYQSKAAYTPSTGSERFRGHWGGSTNTAQGYTLPNWFVDVALRKDLFDRKASVTLNVQDIFRTRKSGTHTESGTFIQDTWRVRDPQVVRLNFSYRFGKMDASLFKRKNNRVGTEGMDMMQ